MKRNCKICEKEIEIYVDTIGRDFRKYVSNEGVFFDFPYRVWFCNGCWRFVCEKFAQSK